MDSLFRLETMLANHQSVFKSENFNHFRGFVMGLINMQDRPTLTNIYQAGSSKTTYWALPKFLSRGQWYADEATACLTRQVRSVFSQGVYVYDETHVVKMDSEQYGVHFFPKHPVSQRQHQRVEVSPR